MELPEVQQQLFQAIKSRLPAEASVVDEVAKLLNISSDSAYRRMRGEKPISLDELYALCTTFKISVDQLMNINTGGFIFQGNIVDNKDFRFDAYLTGVMHQMAYINSFKEKTIYYLCKDAPLFHHFLFRDFAAFKYFVWMSTIFGFPEFKKRKIRLSEYPDEFTEMGQRILHLYNQIDSVEIWNIENLNVNYRQIDFLIDGDMFESDSEVLKVYEALEKVMDHLEKQAQLGYKFNYDDPQKKPLGKYSMYFNEVILGDNTILAIMDNTKMAFLPHSVMNYLMTRDPIFCDKFHQYLQGLMKSSTLISEVSEKERSKFFKIHRERIENRKAALRV